MLKIPTTKLNNGEEIPGIGFGTWMLKEEEACKTAIKAALECGYRHFDTAQAYQNEQFIGAALQESDYEREDVFVTTKISKDNMRTAHIDATFNESLSKLKTDYVDLLLLHFPATEWRRPAWWVMEKIYESGRAHAIGVSNYTIRHLEELLRECRIKPAVNQLEQHVYLQQPDLIEYCQANDIVVTAYSPLARNRDMDNEVLNHIARKHGKTVAQVMVRWCIDRGLVPLPRSSKPEHIIENIQVFDFSLDADDLARIATLNRNMHTTWDPTNVP